MSRLPHLLPTFLPAELLQSGPPRRAAGGSAGLLGAPGWMRVSPGGPAAGGSAALYAFSLTSNDTDSIGKFNLGENCYIAVQFFVHLHKPLPLAPITF